MPDERQATFRQLASVREYRALFTADVLSVVGDQVAVVALAVLVYQRSGSTLLTALIYSLAFLPWVAGGPFLAALADRWPRRDVLVMCSGAQFLLVGVAAVPGLPMPALVVLVTVAAFLAPPFEAARGALLPDILGDDRYVLATSVSVVTHQAGALLGFVVGGSLVAMMSAEGALGLDAATFLLTALLMRFGLRDRTSAASEAPTSTSLWKETLEGIGIVARHPQVRALLLLVWLVSLYLIVPEALAAGYAAELGRGPQAVGLFMASAAGGVVVGSALLTRLVPPDRRLEIMRPLALLGAVPLVVVAAHPGFTISVLCFVAAGACSASMIPARAAVMTAIPTEVRGRVFGVAATGLALAQVIGILAAGAAAQAAPVSMVIASSGIVGIVALFISTRGAARRSHASSEPTAQTSTELALQS
jgi:MFS family permease